MLFLREHRPYPHSLADWLTWFGLVAPGVVLNKDGAFQRTARFRGPDLDSETNHRLAVTANQVNNVLKRLGSGWALFIGADRHTAAAYPRESIFPDPLSRVIDEERRATFEAAGSRYESSYTLTFFYLPPPDREATFAGFLVLRDDKTAPTSWNRMATFIEETDRIFNLFDGLVPELEWLDDSETLSFLHNCVSTKRQRVACPETPIYLDYLLADEPLTGGVRPRLGGAHLRVLTVSGLPHATWPGILDELNHLGFPYRWMTRFIFLDKIEAERELVRLRRHWWAKRKSLGVLIREILFKQETPLVDTDAEAKAADVDRALESLGADDVSFGYVTSTLVVTDPVEADAEEKLRLASRVIESRGMVNRLETYNAVEAWLSSIPGHVYANVRRPMVSTRNLAHLMPLSAVWAGPERNVHLDGPPLIVTRTAGGTPFRLVTHVGDVGHTLVVGPTGSGKSVLLATLVAQFRRYRDSQVFIFDKGGSARAMVLGLGGEHYDLTPDGGITFQPLADADQPAEQSWAAEWVNGLLLHEKVTLNPETKEEVWLALKNLGSGPREQRTLTGLSALISRNELRQALRPYTLDGRHRRLLDDSRDRLGSAPVQCFEMEQLMQSSAFAPVLLYLFHRLEKRFDGRPTLLVLDEAWLFLDSPLFAAQIRDWLKTLRKRNVSVTFATQSLADIANSNIAPAIIESCPSRIFLPNPQAGEAQIRPIYQGFNLNDRQIEILTFATPKQDYYYQSPHGNRLFDLELGPAALAFAGAGTPEDHRAIDACLAEHGSQDFASAWLSRRGVGWAADRVAFFSSLARRPEAA